MSAHRTRWLLEKELRELAASRSYWLLLLVVGALVGHQFMTATGIYAEASGAGGGPAALSQGLSPLEGIIVPTLGAYDIAATLLFPFVVIRLIANEKQTGALALTLQSPLPLAATMTAKLVALLAAWFVAGLAGAAALLAWRGAGGHLYAPETMTVVLGHLLRGLLTIGVSAAAAAFATSAASAAIVALTVTLGTWALDYVAAARGGVIASVAAYTPSAALRVFEHGELRVATVLILLTLGLGGVVAATAWLREGEPASHRARDVGMVLLSVVILCVLFAGLHDSRDVSEDRRNSFPRADEAALRAIEAPLHVTVYLAAEDPRLVDLERGVLAKLRRTMKTVDVTYAASGRSGLFERPDQHYGEIWYQLGDRREMTRSTTDEIVLETIYRLAGRNAPSAENETPYRGYPLAARMPITPWLFFLAWPLCVILTWWEARRPRVSRRRSE
jgi:ABC-2 type transport system permease protein